MSGEGGFLSRWARRKQEVQRTEAERPQLTVEPAAPPETDVPVIDPASLPPAESLTAESSLAPFLQKGVPEAVKNAALRTMWAADPAIRDYVGPADFQWDFNAPGAITGFGTLDTGIDVGQMVADVTEYHLKPPVEAAAPPGTPAVLPAPAAPDEPTEAVTLAAPDEGADDITGADGEATRVDGPATPPRRRRHGGATPV